MALELFLIYIILINYSLKKAVYPFFDIFDIKTYIKGNQRITPVTNIFKITY